MKVLIIGGTGLLGFEAAKQFIERGHRVKGIGLPPLQEDLGIPEGYEIVLTNYLTLPDDQMRELIKGSQVLVFAAGIDERYEGKAPIIEAYRRYNVEPVKRLLSLARLEGVNTAIILGSYFAYAAKKYPQWRLDQYHPYIKSRLEQEEAALSFSKDGSMNVAILELPYIFGVQAGRAPVWKILLEQIMKMKQRTYYPDGGTALVSVRQVGQAIYGAALKTEGGVCYPIGYYNFSWRQLISRFHRYANIERSITTIPKWIYRLGVRFIVRKKRKEGIDMGLDIVRFSTVMCSRLFIDKNEASTYLGVKPDHINKAIELSVKASLKALRGTPMIEMKAE